MTRTLTTKLLLLCCMVLGYLQMQAQGWEKKYSPDGHVGFNAIYPMHDGSFLTTGFLTSPQRVMKIASNGQVVWQKDYDSLLVSSVTNITQDGGLIIAAIAQNDSPGTPVRAIMRIDSNGQKLWLKTVNTYASPSSPFYNTGGSEFGDADIDTTDNGGFIYAFIGSDSLAAHRGALYITRLNATGDILWEKTYLDTASLLLEYSIRNSKDGGFIVTAAENVTGGNFAFKIDSAGNILWVYIPVQTTYLAPALMTDDGSILLLSAPYPINSGNNSIIKLNQNGSVIRTQAYPTLPDSSDWYGPLIPVSNNAYSVIGAYSFTDTLTNITNERFSFSIIDTAGNFLFFNSIPSGSFGDVTTLQEGYKAIARTADNGYLFGGWIPNDRQGYTGFLIKMDSNGVVYPATVSGLVFSDINNNCFRDSGEISLSNVTVTFTGAVDTLSIIANNSGYYSIGLNTGNYNINVTPPSPYWQPSGCNPASVTFATGSDTNISLGLVPVIYSPYIVINGYLGPEVVWCEPAIYTAEYCNNGTAPFTGAIQITIDSTILQVDSASMPILSHWGNQYTFNADSLGIMQCATFKVYVTVLCNADLAGRTACIDAQAMQDTILTGSSLWDRSNLDLQANYNPVTDTVTFILKNKGTGGMGTPEDLIVIEDNVILLHIPQQLIPGGQFVQPVKANGSTLRATINQTTYNPYSKFVTAAIEGAGTNQQGGISIGYYTQYPYNGYTSYEYNACSEIRNAYDPNQKTVTPKGAGPDKLIDTTVSLEYVIDFQNTGNTSAYAVTVIDTLPPYLNPSTIRLEVSSAPCQMQLSGTHAVIFTLNNINLPDSGTGQMASTGFVKFGINQKPGNALGTVINNTAGIYFDYNQPVITNTATVRIGQLLFTDIQSVYANKKLLINAYPNPFNTDAIIKVEGETFNDLQLNVYDLTGRLVKQQRAQNTNQFILNRTDLESGSYIFEITSNGKPVGDGKIIAQ